MGKKTNKSKKKMKLERAEKYYETELACQDL